MKKRLILTLTCITILALGYANVKVYAATEETITGIGTILDRVDPIEIKTALEIEYNWTNDNVNFREEPNTNSNIIKTLDKRIKVEVVKKVSDEWTKVKWDEKIGYIYSKYLRDTELPSLDFTKKEIEMLQRITEAEVEGQSFESKENVASTIINRVLSDKFPDDIESVIFADNQFAPIRDGRYNSVDITKSTIKAVNKVLENGATHDCLFFCNFGDIKSLRNKKWFQNLEIVFTDDSGTSYYRIKGGEQD